MFFQPNRMMWKKLIDVKNHSKTGICVESQLGFHTFGLAPALLASRCAHCLDYSWGATGNSRTNLFSGAASQDFGGFLLCVAHHEFDVIFCTKIRVRHGHLGGPAPMVR